MKCAADEVGKDADVSGSVEMHRVTDSRAAKHNAG